MKIIPSQSRKPGSLSTLGLCLVSALLPCSAPAPTYNLFTTQVPAPSAFYQDYPNGVLATRFHAAVAGKITGLRYYAQPGDSDATTLILWDYASQTQLGSVSGAPDGTEGWFQLSLASTVNVTAGTEYVVSYDAGANGNYIGWSHFFDTPLANGPLTAPVGAGIFGDSGFPTQGPYQNASYFADVVFETAVGMTVQGNGVTITNGEAAPNAGDGTHFGALKLGAPGQNRTFTIRNPGTADLVLSGNPVVVIAGAQAGDFVVTAQPTTPVPPAGSTTFTVQFAPMAGGIRNASVVITNNAGGPFQFAVEGVGMGSGGYAWLGNQTANTVQTLPAGQITGSQFGALRNLRLTQISVRVAQLSAQSGNAVLKAAIYSDTGGAPDQFLGGTTELSNPTNGWYSLALAQPVNVAVLSNYWLVVWANGDQIALYANSAGRQQWNQYSYDVTWPSSLDLSGGSGNGTLCLYATGVPTDDVGPEMSVQGNGVWVPSGGTNVTSANGTDVGGCSLYGGTRLQSFSILNLGQSSLSLTGVPAVTVTGPASSDFVVTAQPTGSVAAGGNTALAIKFSPSAAGPRQATVLIPHADSASAYSFAIQGEGLALSGAGVIGNDGVGTDSRPIGAVITGNRFIAPADMQITDLRAKIIKGPGNFACAVYADNSGVAGRLLGATAPVPATTNGWNTYHLPSPLSLAAGSFYWLMIGSDSTAGAIQMDYVGTGYIGAYAITDLTVPWPDPILLTPIGVEPRTYCIYAEGVPLKPAPGAAMDVRGGGQLIVFGDTLPSTLDGTDFGNAPLRTGTIDHTFTIQNSGSVPLVLTGTPPVAITGPQAGDFKVTSPPTSPVPPGGSTTFTLRFTPSAVGLRTAAASIGNNDVDPDKNPYQFAVQGAGFVAGRETIFPDSQVGADVDNDGTQYDLGVIFSAAVAGTITELRVFSVAGDLGAHTCWIWNTSDGSAFAGPYTWDFGGVTGWIYLDIPPVAIEANAQYTVDITTGQGPMHDYANIAGILTDAGGNGVDLSYPASAGVFINPNAGPPLNTMPNQSWNGSSYLRDIVFVPAGSSAVVPDMGLIGNGNLIPDGYSSPNATNNTDFGAAPAGGGTADLSLVITNSGTAPLNLTGTPAVGFTGPQAGDFKVVTQPATPIPPSGKSTLTLRFAPSATGPRKALVSIQNDDKNPFYFAISGTGSQPFRLTSITPDLKTGNVTLQWLGPGQQFQVLRATAVTGPFTPIGAPQPGTSYTDPGILKTNASAFYRIRY